MAKITDAMLVLMNAGAERNDGMIPSNPKHPKPTRQKMADALVTTGMATWEPTFYDGPMWAADESDGSSGFFGLRLTREAFQHLGVDPAEFPEYLQGGGDEEEDIDLPEPDASGVNGSVAISEQVQAEANAVADEIDAKAKADQMQPARVSEIAALSHLTDGLEGERYIVTIAIGRPNEAAAIKAAAAYAKKLGMDVALRQQGATEAMIITAKTKAGKPAKNGPAGGRKPREPRADGAPTKQQQVIDMLKRQAGASIAQIMDSTGWQQHTVRGFFAGLKKKGHAVANTMEGRERVYRIPA